MCSTLGIKSSGYISSKSDFSSYLWIRHWMQPDFLILRHDLYQEQRMMLLLEHFQILKGSAAVTWVKFAVRLQYFAAEVPEPCTQSHWNLSKKSDDAFMICCCGKPI